MALSFVLELKKKEMAERRELNMDYSDEAKQGPKRLESAARHSEAPLREKLGQRPRAACFCHSGL